MSILVISPHMDDETFGAGGYILKKIDKGIDAYWLNIANAKTEYGYDAGIIDKRSKLMDAVSKAYGFKDVIDLALKPTCLSEYEDNKIINEISILIDKVKPEILLIPYYDDVHSDHRKVFEWCLPFSKSFRYGYVKKVLMMEIISETDFAVPEKGFVPNYYVDISDYIDEKINIVKIYEDELKEHPFPRSIENIKALSLHRGTYAGTKDAEAYKTLKIID